MAVTKAEGHMATKAKGHVALTIGRGPYGSQDWQRALWLSRRQRAIWPSRKQRAIWSSPSAKNLMALTKLEGHMAFTKAECHMAFTIGRGPHGTYDRQTATLPSRKHWAIWLS